MERCPFCQARLAEDTPNCPRCDADLSLPLQCLAQADDYRQQAIAALIEQRPLAEVKQFLVQATLQKQNLLSEVLINFMMHYQEIMEIFAEQKMQNTSMNHSSLHLEYTELWFKMHKMNYNVMK